MGRKEDYIDRNIRESNLSPYGLAIRLQQQYGMSWREATARAGYDDTPTPVYTPKPESPRYIPTSEDIAKQERIFQESSERLMLHRERLKKDPVDRIHELMDIIKARKQLLAIRDNLLKGVGEVDQDPIISSDSSSGTHIGVLMLRVPYMSRLTDTVTHSEVTGWTWSDACDPSEWATIIDSSTTRDVEDFASVRVGIYLPYLSKDFPSFFPENDAERIGAQVLESNFGWHHQNLRDHRQAQTNVERGSWPVSYQCFDSNGRYITRIEDSFTTLPNDKKPATVLKGLLASAIKNTPIDIPSLTKPLPLLPPIKQDQPWYKRFFG